MLSAKATILYLANDEGAIAVADQAVALATAWKVELLLRRAMLQRSWLRIATADLDEMRETTESLAKTGAAVLEAEARYALYHALQAAGQDGQPEFDKAREQFTTLKMTWHLEKAEQKAPLLARQS